MFILARTRNNEATRIIFAFTLIKGLIQQAVYHRHERGWGAFQRSQESVHLALDEELLARASDAC